MINVGRKNTKIYFVFSLDGIHIVFGRFCYDEGCRWPMQYSGIQKINKLLEMLIMAPAISSGRVRGIGTFSFFRHLSGVMTRT